MHFKKYKKILSPSSGMNIYRGCSHGCIYCDSRSKCYNMDHDFEDILVKSDSYIMLDEELSSKRNKTMVGTGAMSDPYIPEEKELLHTRRCLEVIREHGYGLAIQTKSDLILRDLDVICQICEKTKAVVQITMTTFDENLCRIVEPNVCTTKRRYEVIKILSRHKIPVVVWFSPFLPYINDTHENLKGLLELCIEGGVRGIVYFGAGMTLRQGNREFFFKKLDEHFPGLKKKYIEEFGSRYSVMSKNNSELSRLFYDTCNKYSITANNEEIFRYIHKFEKKEEFTQLSLF